MLEVKVSVEFAVLSLGRITWFGLSAALTQLAEALADRTIVPVKP